MHWLVHSINRKPREMGRKGMTVAIKEFFDERRYGAKVFPGGGTATGWSRWFLVVDRYPTVLSPRSHESGGWIAHGTGGCGGNFGGSYATRSRQKAAKAEVYLLYVEATPSARKASFAKPLHVGNLHGPNPSNGLTAKFDSHPGTRRRQFGQKLCSPPLSY